MAKERRKSSPSAEEMVEFFGPVLADEKHADQDSLSIPGLDAYVPSYTSNRTDQSKSYGQLEPNPR